MGLAFPDPPLSAAGVVLRRLDTGDIGWITAACSDREMSRHIPAMPYPYSQAHARAFVQHAPQAWSDGSSAAFVIARAPGGEGLGMVGVHFPAADPGLAEVGYWLRREARGRGAATIAVRLVSGWAFGPLGIERLSLMTAPQNEASQRVAQRAGFTREGLLRAWTPAADGRRDILMFALLPGDLTSAASGRADA
jgi:RimJ/RimL family protein N-acetyltransferase